MVITGKPYQQGEDLLKTEEIIKSGFFRKFIEKYYYREINEDVKKFSRLKAINQSGNYFQEKCKEILEKTYEEIDQIGDSINNHSIFNYFLLKNNLASFSDYKQVEIDFACSGGELIQSDNPGFQTWIETIHNIFIESVIYNQSKRESSIPPIEKMNIQGDPLMHEIEYDIAHFSTEARWDNEGNLLDSWETNSIYLENYEQFRQSYPTIDALFDYCKLLSKLHQYLRYQNEITKDTPDEVQLNEFEQITQNLYNKNYKGDEIGYIEEQREKSSCENVRFYLELAYTIEIKNLIHPGKPSKDDPPYLKVFDHCCDKTRVKIIDEFKDSVPYLYLPFRSFKIFTEELNPDNNDPYLTDNDFHEFIKEAFQEKQKTFKFRFNKRVRGDIGKIIAQFYNFYVITKSAFDKRDKYIKLLSDNFEDFEFEKVKRNFDKGIPLRKFEKIRRLRQIR